MNACEQCDHKEKCKYCSDLTLLRLNEVDINYTKRVIFELEYDVDTWAYTITGNKEARRLSYELTSIMMDYATPEEKERYSDDYPDELWREFLERGFDEIVEWIISQSSRLLYQLLGEEIMYYGAKMSEDIRELILLHSEWEDEQDQLEDEQDQAERKYYLLDFREKIKNYKEGVSINIPRKTKHEIFEKHTRDKNGLIIIDRKPIDYRVMKSNK